MFFFFNDPAPTEIYPLSLHDALPIYPHPRPTRSTSLGLRAPPNWRRLLGPPPRASRRWPPPLRDAPAPRDTWPSRATDCPDRARRIPQAGRAATARALRSESAAAEGPSRGPR